MTSAKKSDKPKKFPKRPFIIGVAGTKGKTTVTRALAHVYHTINRTTLHVDTDGHYVNGKQRGTWFDSMEIWHLVPTTCPGRFLYEIKDETGAIAVLELSIESFLFGTGYRLHDIGVFTNIFEDHIGLRIKSRQQLADEKAEYLFGRISRRGTAVFNADDPLIVERLNVIPAQFSVKLLPVGLDFNHFDLDQHLNQGGQAITVRDGWVDILSSQGFEHVLNVADIPWTFEGNFTPSLYNLMLIIGALYAEQGFTTVPAPLLSALRTYQLAPSGGRLTMLENKDKGLKVLLDFAHEKYSVNAVAELARKLAKGKTIGVIRFSPTKTDEVLHDTGHAIADAFDRMIIYDKVDGILRQRVKMVRHGFTREVGDVAQRVYEAIQEAQSPGHEAEVVIQEAKAVARAFELAKSGDVIVHIVNDDHEQSIKYIKEHLEN